MKNKQIISAIVLIVLLVWLGYYGYNNRSDLAELGVASPWLIALLIGISLVTYVAIAMLNNTLLSALKVKMPLRESFMLSIITGFYNLITPFRGGMAVRAVYLKQKYKFAYVHFLASLSAVYFNDILRAIELIEKSFSDIQYEEFESNLDLIDATAMRLQIIGESPKEIASKV